MKTRATVTFLLACVMSVVACVTVPTGGGEAGEQCGNDFCGSGENVANCPVDCGGSTGGGVGEICGNDFCGSGENVSNCPGDCGGGSSGGSSSGGGGSSGDGSSGGGGLSDDCGDNPFFADDRVQADAGPNLTIDAGTCVSLIGRITEGHAPFTVAWTSPGMSFPSGETKVTACPEETATFTFTVKDSCDVQDMDPMTITIRDNSGGDDGSSSEGSADGSTGSGSSGEESSDLATHFAPGTYSGIVTQESTVNDRGVVDRYTHTSNQDVVINSEGMVDLSVGDAVSRNGFSSVITDVLYANSLDGIEVRYEFNETLSDGVILVGSGKEVYSFVPPDKIQFSGELSVRSTNIDPSWTQDSTLGGTLLIGN